jgi:hypothetical protein
VVRAVTAVGVPEITPVVVLKDNPADNAGLMLYDVIVPPDVLGPIGEMAIPLSNTMGEAYTKLAGAISFTAIVNVLVVDPPELLAVIVYVVAVLNSPGTPEILPVAGSNTNPPGKAGLML